MPTSWLQDLVSTEEIHVWLSTTMAIGEDFGVRYRSRRSASTRIKVSVSNIVKVKIRPARALLLLTAETFLRLFGCVLTRQPSVAHHRARAMPAPVSCFAKEEQI